jgi:hypothetical protein
MKEILTNVVFDEKNRKTLLSEKQIDTLITKFRNY